MLGSLPKRLDVNGTAHPIRSDYRDILRVIQAFHDDELSPAEKVFVCLRNVYTDFDALPQSDYDAAYEAAVRFIDFGTHGDKPSPRVMDWEKDEHIIFPAVNKVAGCEVRALEYLHWWTFMGYFQGIDREDTFGYVLMLRQKRAKHKKLEKWEQEFYNANRTLVDLSISPNGAQTAEDQLAQIYKELLEEEGGGEDG